jgi:xanthine dehydrogenase YagS FAD-binding subunit
VIQAFSYRSPRTLEAAVAALAPQWGETAILAGGSDLLALMKERLETPRVVVDVKRIPALGGVEVKEGRIRIGANTTMTELSEHGAIRKHLPALAKAAGDLGSVQIRNVATLGGNLCQRNRDWYFRNGLDPEVKEELQYSAIFPIDGQVYVHPSTLAPVLIAYGATVDVVGPKGSRTVPVEKFFQTADSRGKREAAIAADEIVTQVHVPATDVRSAEVEIRERLSHDWPLVQAAAALTMDGDVVAKAAIVLGHVAPVPRRSAAAEKVLVGRKVDAETAAAAGRAAAEGATTTPKNEYKAKLVQVAVKRAVLGAVGDEYWRGA